MSSKSQAHATRLPNYTVINQVKHWRGQLGPMARGEMTNDDGMMQWGGEGSRRRGEARHEPSTYPDARGHVLVGLEQLRDLAAHLAHLHLLAVPQQLDPRHRHPQRRLAGKPHNRKKNPKQTLESPTPSATQRRARGGAAKRKPIWRTDHLSGLKPLCRTPESFPLVLCISAAAAAAAARREPLPRLDRFENPTESNRPRGRQTGARATKPPPPNLSAFAAAVDWNMERLELPPHAAACRQGEPNRRKEGETRLFAG